MLLQPFVPAIKQRGFNRAPATQKSPARVTGERENLISFSLFSAAFSVITPRERLRPCRYGKCLFAAFKGLKHFAQRRVDPPSTQAAPRTDKPSVLVGSDG